MCIPAHVCSAMHGAPFLGVCFRVGRTQDAESGRGPWLVSGSVQEGSRACAWGQTGLQIPLTLPAPCHRHCLRLCHQAVPAASPHPTGRAVSPLHSLLLSLLTQCFELYILQKQPRPLVCSGEGLGALSWGTDFPGSSAEDSCCLWKKKRKESSPFYFKTADSNTMQYMLFFVSGRCVCYLGR